MKKVLTLIIAIISVSTVALAEYQIKDGVLYLPGNPCTQYIVAVSSQQNTTVTVSGGNQQYVYLECFCKGRHVHNPRDPDEEYWEAAWSERVTATPKGANTYGPAAYTPIYKQYIPLSDGLFLGNSLEYVYTREPYQIPYTVYKTVNTTSPYIALYVSAGDYCPNCGKYVETSYQYGYTYATGYSNVADGTAYWAGYKFTNPVKDTNFTTIEFSSAPFTNQFTNVPYDITIRNASTNPTAPSKHVLTMDGCTIGNISGTPSKLILKNCDFTGTLTTSYPVEATKCTIRNLRQSSKHLVLTNCTVTDSASISDADISYGAYTGTPAFTSRKVNLKTAGIQIIDKSGKQSLYDYDVTELVLNTTVDSSTSTRTTITELKNPPIKLEVESLEVGIQAAIESIDWSKVAEGLNFDFSAEEH